MPESWIINNQKIIRNDCILEMQSFLDSSFDVIVTSPPYNVGVKYNSYNDNLNNDEYLKWIHAVFTEIKRILKDNGSFFLNVGNRVTCPYITMDLCAVARNIGFVLQNDIVWIKSITVNDDSFGHFKPMNTTKKYINHQHESIFHFTKTGDVVLDRLAIGVPYKHKRNVGRYSDIDLRCRGNVWYIPYETVQRKKTDTAGTPIKLHPASFPVKLPEMCIKLAGIKENMVVLDPFLGTGTTLLATKRLGVSGVGIEIDKTYCEIAIERIK